MVECPVCGEKSNEPVCRVCGFDRSCYYEMFPTLGEIPGSVSSAQKRRAAHNRDKRNLLCCVACGHTAFEILFKEREARCANCGFVVSWEQVDSMAPIENPRCLLAAGFHHTAILHRNGIVEIAGEGSGLRTMAEWSDVVCVTAGDRFTAALNKSGAVYVDGFVYDCQSISKWKDVSYIYASGSHLFGLRKDGTVESADRRLRDWKNITAVAAGNGFVVGLQRDGRGVSAGSNDYGQCNVEGWHDIVDLAAGNFHTVGLKKDGTVVAAGYNAYGQCNVTAWKNIVAVSAGPHYTLGLREDGTVLSTMLGHKTSVGKWKDIIAVSAGEKHVVGLGRNGTFWAAGENKNGRCDVNGLKW